MKVFIFRYNKYPFNVGDPMYDIMFANDLEEAKQIRAKSIKEDYCPTAKCVIEEKDIIPGFFYVNLPYKDADDMFAVPVITKY